MSEPMHKNFDHSSERLPAEQDRHDQVWNLLAKDQATHDLSPSPWFATRTTAMALQTPQRKNFFSHLSVAVRWLIPVPLAGVVALTFLVIHNTPQQSPTVAFVSSETEFEQHMEMIADNSE